MKMLLVVYTVVQISFVGGGVTAEKDYTYEFDNLQQCTTALMALTRHSNANAECLPKDKYEAKKAHGKQS